MSERISKIVLERMMSYSISRLPADRCFVGLEPDITQRIEYATDDLVLQMRSYVWAQEIQHDTSQATVELEVEVPADWWQHFKERWFPAWARKRWPVATRTIRKTETVTHHFRCMATLPDFNYVPPPTTGERYILKTQTFSTRGDDE